MPGYRPKSPAEERVELEALIKSAKEGLIATETELELAREDAEECRRLRDAAMARLSMAYNEKNKISRELEDLEAEWRGYK